MFRKSLAVLALLVALAPVAHADTLSLDQILAKHYEAEGGLDKLQKVQTMRFTGKMTVGPGMEAPFSMEKKRPAMQRLEFSFSGMTGIQAFDGAQGWSVMPFMGKKTPEPMAADDQKEMADQADFDGPLVDWKAKGHAVELLGKETVDGAEAYKLKLTKKGGQVEYYYVDAETFLLVKEEAKRTMHGTEMDGVSTFADYKDVNGLMLPYTMTNGIKGSEQKQTMTFEKIETDVALADARFKLPAAAADSSAAKPAAAKPAAGKGAPPKKGK